MRILKSKLRQIIKEELIEEVSSLPRKKAICVGFMHKLSDELNKILPSYEGVLTGDIVQDLEDEGGECYDLFVQALQEIGAEFGDTWEQTKEKLANSRYRNAREEWEQYNASQMSPKKMVDPVKRMGTAPTITQPRVNTKPLYQAPMPSSNPFKVGKLGPDGKYRFE